MTASFQIPFKSLLWGYASCCTYYQYGYFLAKSTEASYDALRFYFRFCDFKCTLQQLLSVNTAFRSLFLFFPVCHSMTLMSMHKMQSTWRSGHSDETGSRTQQTFVALSYWLWLFSQIAGSSCASTSTSRASSPCHVASSLIHVPWILMLNSSRTFSAYWQVTSHIFSILVSLWPLLHFIINNLNISIFRTWLWLLC
jgi:hypothetical protein